MAIKSRVGSGWQVVRAGVIGLGLLVAACSTPKKAPTVVAAPPPPLVDLPVAVEPRRLPAGVTGRLGLSEPHGHSLVGRNAAVLLWRLGGEVWALRLPRGEALTKS